MHDLRGRAEQAMGTAVCHGAIVECAIDIVERLLRRSPQPEGCDGRRRRTAPQAQRAAGRRPGRQAQPHGVTRGHRAVCPRVRPEHPGEQEASPMQSPGEHRASAS